jgi:hypothetical protein
MRAIIVVTPIVAIIIVVIIIVVIVLPKVPVLFIIVIRNDLLFSISPGRIALSQGRCVVSFEFGQDILKQFLEVIVL